MRSFYKIKGRIMKENEEDVLEHSPSANRDRNEKKLD